MDSAREASQFDHFPFPVLIKISEENLTVEMSYCGWSLDQFPWLVKPLKILNYKAQVENIVAMLVKSRVMHLDLRPDGKNLCVDREGNISMIDFDIVVINDEKPLSGQIKRRAIKTKNFPDGYQTWAVNKINRALLKYSDQLELL